jgi:uncharacterized protein Smg (DUF494 family)
MQERIVEIIVYLLSALQFERNAIEARNFSSELIKLGYLDNEITLAFSWIYNHLKGTKRTEIEEYPEEELDDILETEELIVSPDAYGYIIHLLHLGVLREAEIETVVERAMAYGKTDIGTDDIKSIVATIIFGSGNVSAFNKYTFFQDNQTIH